MYELHGINYLFVEYFKLLILAINFFTFRLLQFFSSPRVYLIHVHVYFYSVHVIIWQKGKEKEIILVSQLVPSCTLTF